MRTPPAGELRTLELCTAASAAVRRVRWRVRLGLNDLLGSVFRIGDVFCRGTELCEPCRHLDELTGKRLLRPLASRTRRANGGGGRRCCRHRASHRSPPFSQAATSSAARERPVGGAPDTPDDAPSTALERDPEAASTAVVAVVIGWEVGATVGCATLWGRADPARSPSRLFDRPSSTATPGLSAAGASCSRPGDDRKAETRSLNASGRAARRVPARGEARSFADEELGRLPEAFARLELRDTGAGADGSQRLGPALSRLASSCADDRPSGEARPA